MLTLEEAIKHCEEVAEKKEYIAETVEGFDEYTREECLECASEHRQLAEWLKKLQTYEKIIFELSEAMQCYDGCERCQGFREYSTSDFVDDVRSWVNQFGEVNADEERGDNK